MHIVQSIIVKIGDDRKRDRIVAYIGDVVERRGLILSFSASQPKLRFVKNNMQEGDTDFFTKPAHTTHRNWALMGNGVPKQKHYTGTTSQIRKIIEPPARKRYVNSSY